MAGAGFIILLSKIEYDQPQHSAGTPYTDCIIHPADYAVHHHTLPQYTLYGLHQLRAITNDMINALCLSTPYTDCILVRLERHCA